MTITLHSPAIMERWKHMTLPEQLGNIGSEIHRTLMAQQCPDRFALARARALELLDLTLADARWSEVPKKELLLLKQQFDSATTDRIDLAELTALDTYCFQFGMLVALQKERALT